MKGRGLVVTFQSALSIYCTLCFVCLALADTAYVSSTPEGQVAAAFKNNSVTYIVLQSDVIVEGLPTDISQNPVEVNRNITITSQDPSNVRLLNFQFARRAVSLCSTCRVVLQNVAVANDRKGNGPFVDFFTADPGGAVLFNDVVRLRLACVSPNSSIEQAFTLQRSPAFPGKQDARIVDFSFRGQSYPDSFRVDNFSYRVEQTFLESIGSTGGYDLYLQNTTRICEGYVDANCLDINTVDVCVAQQTDNVLQQLNAARQPEVLVAVIAVPVTVGVVILLLAAVLLLLRHHKRMAMLRQDKSMAQEFTNGNRSLDLEMRLMDRDMSSGEHPVSVPAVSVGHEPAHPSRGSATTGATGASGGAGTPASSGKWQVVYACTAPDAPIAGQDVAVVGEYLDGTVQVADINLGVLLGAGSYGRVFWGTWHGMEVAVKIIDHMDGSELVEVGNEAKLLLSLDHPNIVKAYSFLTCTWAAAEQEHHMAPQPSSSNPTALQTLMKRQSLETGNKASREENAEQQGRQKQRQHQWQRQQQQQRQHQYGDEHDEQTDASTAAIARLPLQSRSNSGINADRSSRVNSLTGNAAPTPSGHNTLTPAGVRQLKGGRQLLTAASMELRRESTIRKAVPMELLAAGGPAGMSETVVCEVPSSPEASAVSGDAAAQSAASASDPTAGAAEALVHDFGPKAAASGSIYNGASQPLSATAEPHPLATSGSFASQLPPLATMPTIWQSSALIASTRGSALSARRMSGGILSYSSGLSPEWLPCRGSPGASGLDVPSSDGRCVARTWIVQEYCDGGGLYELLMQLRQVQSDNKQGYMLNLLLLLEGAARGLAHAHEGCIVHGDVNARNVLVCSADCAPGVLAKISDFGLSRRVTTSHRTTDTYGTISHMPPERLTRGRLSAAGDVYAFGIMMWELWMGNAAFRGQHFGQVCEAVVLRDVRPEVPDDMPAGYRQLMEDCWVRDPATRPTMEQVGERLLELMEQHSGVQHYDVSTTIASLLEPLFRTFDGSEGVLSAAQLVQQQRQQLLGQQQQEEQQIAWQQQQLEQQQDALKGPSVAAPGRQQLLQQRQHLGQHRLIGVMDLDDQKLSAQQPANPPNLMRADSRARVMSAMLARLHTPATGEASKAAVSRAVADEDPIRDDREKVSWEQYVNDL